MATNEEIQEAANAAYSAAIDAFMSLIDDGVVPSPYEGEDENEECESAERRFLAALIVQLANRAAELAQV